MVIDLSSTDPPWVIAADPSDAAIGEGLIQFRASGGVVVPVDGAAFSSPAGVFSSLAEALDFPGYFGNNWDALADSLSDLHPHVTGDFGVVVRLSDAALIADVEFVQVFVEVLCQAAETVNLALDADGIPTGITPKRMHFLLDMGCVSQERLRGKLDGGSLVIDEVEQKTGIQLAPGYWDAA